MAASYATLGTIAAQPDFQPRVYEAIIQAALNIYAESTTTAGHVARSAYAVRTLQNGIQNSQTWLYGIMASTVISAGASTGSTSAGNGPGYGIADTDIFNQVSAMWNAMAGV